MRPLSVAVGLLAGCAEVGAAEEAPWGGFVDQPEQLALPAPVSAGWAWWSRTAGRAEGPCADGWEGALRYAVEPGGYAGGAALVVTESSCTGDAVGRTRWDVAPLLRDAPVTPAAWNLPARGDEAAPWAQSSGATTEGCGDGSEATRAWGTVDLDGDGLVDLVLTQDGCGDPGVGVDHWDVYRGGATGFAAAPTPWALPAAAVALPFPWGHLEGGDTWGCPDGGYGDLTHALRDLDGDGWTDLVVTRDDCADPLVGEDHWAVYRGGEAGFVATPVSWALPPRSGGRPWWTVDGYAGASCTLEVEGAQREVRDLDGDGVPDLLVTADVCADDWDPAAWRLFPGRADGFAASPVRWALPEASTSAGWPRSSGSDSAGVCTDGSLGSRHWALVDLDGDGFDELVATFDGCLDDGPGDTAWFVYPNRGDGFAPDARRWTLPSGSVADSPKWELLATDGGGASCLFGGWGSLNYTTVDLDGDGVVDLLVTTDACADPTAGYDHWRVFRGVAG